MTRGLDWKRVPSFSYHLSPEDLLCLGSCFREEPSCLLFSGGTRETAQKSFLGLFPIEECCLNKGSPSLWSDLQKTIGEGSSSSLPDWMGYLSYEMGAYVDPSLALPYEKSSLPFAHFFRPGILLEVDREGAATLWSRLDEKETDEFLSSSIWKSLGEKQILPSPKEAKILERSDGQQGYFEKIARIRGYIENGDCYQINLSQQFVFSTSDHPYDIFWRVMKENPGSFCAYFQWKGLSIVSTSPERLLSLRQGRLETRPIKGTAPRFKDPKEDEVSKQTLLSSKKDRAELLMITDLMRNDLGMVSETGTVQTPELCTLEAYSNVYHLVSRIQSEKLNGLHSVEVLRGCFPGGSITGCPKLRVMQLIHELEQRPRGIYTGSLGYFSGNGDFDFNIAIRTLSFFEGIGEVQVGGGIVLDSDPHMEYMETYHKGRSLFQALGLSLQP